MTNRSTTSKNLEQEKEINNQIKLMIEKGRIDGVITYEDLAAGISWQSGSAIPARHQTGTTSRNRHHGPRTAAMLQQNPTG